MATPSGHDAKDGFSKSALGLLLLSTFVGALALAGWTVSTSNLFDVLDLSDQQVVAATMTM